MSLTYQICVIYLPIPVTGPEGPSKSLVLSLELAVTWKGLVHMYIHSKRKLQITKHSLLFLWEPLWMCFYSQSQPLHYPTLCCPLGGTHDLRQLPKACLVRLAVMGKGLIYMHIHRIRRWWSSLYVFDNEVEAILDGSNASTSTLCYCLPLERYPSCLVSSNTLSVKLSSLAVTI